MLCTLHIRHSNKQHASGNLPAATFRLLARQQQQGSSEHFVHGKHQACLFKVKRENGTGTRHENCDQASKGILLPGKERPTKMIGKVQLSAQI